MVIKGAVKFGVQQLAQRGGPKLKQYVTKEYGQIAGSIVGTAIGIASGGDVFNSINQNFGGDKPSNDRNPPFGYYEQGGRPLNGTPYGAQRQALRANYKKSNKHSQCKCRRPRVISGRYYCQCSRRSGRR